MIVNPRQVKPRSAKSGMLAVILQCVPLLLAGGCTANAATNMQSYPNESCFLLIAGLLWGLGYLYLGKLGRFFAAFVLGPIYVIATVYFNEITGARFDFEHFSPDYASVDTIGLASRFMLQEAVMIAAAVLVLAVDAWRLAADHNLQLRVSKGEGEARESAVE